MENKATIKKLDDRPSMPSVKLIALIRPTTAKIVKKNTKNS